MELGAYVCRDVIEFGDESVFNDVNSNFRDDDHKDIRQQHPQVVWGGRGGGTKYFLLHSHWGGSVSDYKASESLLWK